ncbi:MAG: hypothetical protein JW769_04490 [Parachlamydiales bacterium]|nr:hypothetical protein [Parachlamydiales bacterium]
MNFLLKIRFWSPYIFLGTILMVFLGGSFWIHRPLVVAHPQMLSYKKEIVGVRPSLYLQEPLWELSFPNLWDALKVFLLVSRPGEDKNDPWIYLQWTATGEEKILRSGERADVGLCRNLWSFSSLPTGYWIDIQLLKNGILLTSHILADEKNLGTVNIKNRRLVFPLDFYYEGFSVPEELDILKKCSFINPHQILDRDHYRIQTQEGSLFVKEGDILFYSDHGWHKAVNEESLESYSIAKIIRIHEEDMELHGWKKDDPKPYLIRLRSFPKTSMSKDDNVLNSVRLRKKGQVSCYLEKQPTFLQKGDVLEKVQGRWRKMLVKPSQLQAEEYLVVEKITEKALVVSFYNAIADYPCRIKKKISSGEWKTSREEEEIGGERE